MESGPRRAAHFRTPPIIKPRKTMKWNVYTMANSLTRPPENITLLGMWLYRERPTVISQISTFEVDDDGKVYIADTGTRMLTTRPPDFWAEYRPPYLLHYARQIQQDEDPPPGLRALLNTP